MRLRNGIYVFILILVSVTAVPLTMELSVRIAAIALKAKKPTRGLFDFTLRPTAVHRLFLNGLFDRARAPSARDSRPYFFCFGGSTTHGCRVPTGDAFPAQLQSVIDAAGVSGTVYNFGVIGGASQVSAGALRRFADKRPDFVVIHDGYNDLPVVFKEVGENRFSYKIANEIWSPFAGRKWRLFLGTNFWGLVDLFAWFGKFPLQRFENRDDVFLGVLKKESDVRGEFADVEKEHARRLSLFLETELDTIQFCLQRGIRVVLLLEPEIIPEWHPWGTGFSHPSAARILRHFHRLQQEALRSAVINRFGDRVIMVDLRTTFSESRHHFYDESHLLASGNRVKALKIFQALSSHGTPRIQSNTL